MSSTLTATPDEVVAVDLSEGGILVQRLRLNSMVADPKTFLATKIERLERPVKMTVRTCFANRTNQEEFLVLGIVQNGKPDQGSIVLDVSHRSRGLPVVVTSRALADTDGWDKLREMPKQPAN